jgi:hypothetical protein
MLHFQPAHPMTQGQGVMLAQTFHFLGYLDNNTLETPQSGYN